MADLIERDALLDKMEGRYKFSSGQAHKAYGIAIDDICDAPAVDAVPVVRKPVVGYEGYYEVDQFGRVYGIARVVHVADNSREYDKPIAARQMKQSLHTGGYKTVTLTKSGITNTVFVHRIVAEAFIPNPNNLPMVNHKDGDKTNNFSENLEWCTASYNRKYGKAIEKQAKKVRGRESKKRKAIIQRRADGSFNQWYASITEAAKEMNGSTSAISAACKGTRKTAYGYLWEYANLDDFCSYGERRNGDAAD